MTFICISCKGRDLSRKYLLLNVKLQLYGFLFFTYRVFRNDCRGFNNLSYTIHLRE